MDLNKSCVLITVDSHFLFEEDKTIWVESLMDSLFWNKYLHTFETIYVIARMRRRTTEDLSQWLRSDCENVTFLPVEDFRGPKEYLFSRLKIRKQLKEYIKEYRGIITCAIFRLPSTIGFETASIWRKIKAPYAVEAVVDLTDRVYYQQGLIKALIYKIWHYKLKYYCFHAAGTSYVTENALQKKYPAGGFQTFYSSIDLPRKFYYLREPLNKQQQQYIIIHISTLSSHIKGHEVLFQTLRNVIDKGYSVRAVIIGGGALKDYYRKRADDLGLADYVNFTGHLSKKSEIRDELLKANIFVFPTQSEGLPRCVIEAMSCSLPCVSTPIAGIPELLDEEWLCDPFDVSGFAEKITKLIDCVEIYNDVSKRNYETALNYEYCTLMKRRDEFYTKLKEL